MQFGTLIMLPRIMASANMAFWQGWYEVREASSVNNALQINSRDIEDEVARIVTKQRKVSPELLGTTKASTTIDEPLVVAGGVEVNEAAVVT
jgi:hypothetical protein